MRIRHSNPLGLRFSKLPNVLSIHKDTLNSWDEKFSHLLNFTTGRSIDLNETPHGSTGKHREPKCLP